MKKTCFVIQPFDSGKYDKRFKDVYGPAIEAAGLTPYRVDQDPSVQIPIESIEEGIRRASVCLADITTDNPNVWYELGYAFAMGRPVIMVCSQEREGRKYPFDIQHRTVLNYQTDSMSDFEKLREQLTERFTTRREETESTNEPVNERQGHITELLAQIDRTNLAQGQDQITLDYEYELQDEETSVKTTVSDTFNSTWDELFKVIAPSMLAPINEARLNKLITSIVQKMEAPRIKMEHGQKSSASSFSVTEESLGMVKLQFMALRLTQLSGDGWSLTEPGQKKLLESSTIKRSPTSEGDLGDNENSELDKV